MYTTHHTSYSVAACVTPYAAYDVTSSTSSLDPINSGARSCTPETVLFNVAPDPSLAAPPHARAMNASGFASYTVRKCGRGFPHHPPCFNVRWKSVTNDPTYNPEYFFFVSPFPSRTFATYFCKPCGQSANRASFSEYVCPRGGQLKIPTLLNCASVSLSVNSVAGPPPATATTKFVADE